MPRHKHPLYDQIIALAATERSPTKAAAQLNVSLGALQYIWRRAGLSGNPPKDSRLAKEIEAKLKPPSRAMLNLAQFDPVIARALEQRKAEIARATSASLLSRQETAKGSRKLQGARHNKATFSQRA